MTLDQYLSKNDLSSAQFGDQVGASRSQISRIRRGVSRPSWDMVARIAEATGGKVTADDFMEMT